VNEERLFITMVHSFGGSVEPMNDLFLSMSDGSLLESAS
jgi:hypothetical protein